MNIIFSTIITQEQGSNHNNHQAYKVPTRIHTKLINNMTLLETFNVTRPTQLSVVPLKWPSPSSVLGVLA